MNQTRRMISVTLSLLIAVVLLYFAVRDVAWTDVWRTIAHSNPWYLAAGSAISCLSLGLRSFRWRLLLEAERPVTSRAVFWATVLGYFGNAFLPARAGDLARIHAVSRETNLTVAFVLGTAVFERLADGIFLIGVSGLLALTLPARPGWIDSAIHTIGAIGLMGMILLVLLASSQNALSVFVERIPLPVGLRRILRAGIERAIGGLRSSYHPRRLVLFLGFTAAIWFVDAVGSTIGARALGMRIPIKVAFLLLAALGLGSALPSTPGYVGIYQFVAVAVLVPFGFDRSEAIAFITLAQAMSFALIALLGWVAMMRYRNAKPSTAVA